MNINYDIPKIQQILCDLSNLTGLSMAFLDSNYQRQCQCINSTDFCSAIQASGEFAGKCANSDKSVLQKCKQSRHFESHICYAGLYDAAMPIIKDGIFAGVIIMGRIRLEGDEQNSFLSDNPEFCDLYRKLPSLSASQIESLKNLFPNILFQNGIYINLDIDTEEICNYITNNLNHRISLNLICKKFRISKNKLYDTFRKNFGCTINEYITTLRIETAKKMLLETSDPIYLISEKTGIDNYTYFSRLFKKITGTTPSQFRQNR